MAGADLSPAHPRAPSILPGRMGDLPLAKGLQDRPFSTGDAAVLPGERGLPHRTAPVFLSYREHVLLLCRDDDVLFHVVRGIAFHLSPRRSDVGRAAPGDPFS